MKKLPFRSHLVARTMWLSVGAGCALALAPVTTHAQATKEEKDKAAQSQPTDPVESKTGELNAARAGGPVKIDAKDAQAVMMFGSVNAGSIRLGELALKNSESEDVKKFAQMAITSHSKANDELSAVAKKHNIDFPPAPPAEAVEMSKTLLELKGAEFDKKYMGEVVTMATNTLAAYKKAKGETKDHLLTAYVNEMEPKVAKHLEKAKEIDAKLTK